MWKLDLIVIWGGGIQSYMLHYLLFRKKNHINFWLTWRCMGLAETIIVWITPAANSVKVIIEFSDQLRAPLPRRLLYQQGDVSCITVCVICSRYAMIFVNRGAETNRFGIELLLSEVIKWWWQTKVSNYSSLNHIHEDIFKNVTNLPVY